MIHIKKTLPDTRESRTCLTRGKTGEITGSKIRFDATSKRPAETTRPWGWPIHMSDEVRQGVTRSMMNRASYEVTPEEI
jgi:3-polyprenyl-4-hydroxybenzoate decarboxylase